MLLYLYWVVTGALSQPERIKRLIYSSYISITIVKICLLTLEYPPHEIGAAIACRRIAKTLAKKVEVHVLSFARDTMHAKKKSMLAHDIEDGVNVHRISRYPRSARTDVAQDIQVLCSFLEKLDKRHRFDIFHGFDIAGAGFAACFISKKRKKSSVVSVRGDEMGKSMFDPKFFGSIRWTLESADHLAFASDELMQDADIMTPVKDKSTVIPSSLDPFEFFYRDIKLKLDGFVVGFAGVARRDRGFGYLLEAFARFKESHKATLLIVGELLLEEKAAFMKLIEELGIQDSIMITGRVPHHIILNYLGIADVFILPATASGSSEILLEAMFCRRPVITTRKGAGEELIEHNNDGILIEENSTESIYRALQKLAKSKRLRTKLGENAKKRIISEHTPEREQKQLLAIYRKLCKKKRQ